jgi:hypothetical protein
MRNEGPFIVEWVTWYRMLGFNEILLVTNNCTDHSPQLLDALQSAGWLHHLRCDVEPRRKITGKKLTAATQHKAVRRADWLMVCDVDEFLVIHKGNGRITELVGPGGQETSFLAMAIMWRVFGFCNVTAFEDVPVHQQFSLALDRNRVASNSIKMLHRQPRWFKALGEHGPRGFNLAIHGRSMTDPGMVCVNAEGKPIAKWNPDGPYMRTLPKDLVTHEVAQMNHYILRSAETFSLKANTLAPVSLTNRYTDAYVRRANRGDEPDSSAFRYAAEFAALHATAMALPDIARLHALCCADHLKAIFDKAGKSVEDDPRYVAFLAQAAAGA